MSDVLVSVRGLSKSFEVRRGLLGAQRRGVVRAVDDVSFDIRRGETVGLVGESGSGKTTIGRCLLRLVEPDAGEILFDGTDVRALDPTGLRAFRRRAQPVFQDPFGSLDPRMTVGSALDEALRVHRLAGDRSGRLRRVGELLERVGLLPEVAEQRPHVLSGGQRQRVAIARALSVEPDFLVLDEPVSALDVSVRAQVVNLLADLQEELGLTYLFIAHDLALVEHLSDRVAVMYLGRIVEAGPAAELHGSPRHPYTRALLSAVPRVPTRSPEAGRPGRIVLEGEVPSPLTPPPGCPFQPRCPHPLKDEACRAAPPPLEPKAPDHLAACIKEPPTG